MKLYRQKEQLKKDILKKRIVLEKELQIEIQKEVATELAQRAKQEKDTSKETVKEECEDEDGADKEEKDDTSASPSKKRLVVNSILFIKSMFK